MLALMHSSELSRSCHEEIAFLLGQLGYDCSSIDAFSRLASSRKANVIR